MAGMGGRSKKRHIPVVTTAPRTIWPSPPMFHTPLLKATRSPRVVIRIGVVLESVLRTLSNEPMEELRKRPSMSLKPIPIDRLEM